MRAENPGGSLRTASRLGGSSVGEQTKTSLEERLYAHTLPEDGSWLRRRPGTKRRREEVVKVTLNVYSVLDLKRLLIQCLESNVHAIHSCARLALSVGNDPVEPAFFIDVFRNNGIPL